MIVDPQETMMHLLDKDLAFLNEDFATSILLL